MIMKTKNYFSQFRNTLAMLVVLGSTAFFSQDAKAQFSPDFSNFTFYNSSNTNGNDLHYNYGWTRKGGSSGTEVYLSGSNMVAKPASTNVMWFQTVLMELSGTDFITFKHRIANASPNKAVLRVWLVDSPTLQKTLVDTFLYSSANTTSVTRQVNLSQSGKYWILYEFYASGYNSNFQFEVNSMTFTTTPTFLPVNYISYEANQIGDKVALKWITASEINNSHFEIQRSKDGNDWMTLGLVQGNGNSDELNTYQFMDINPMSGINYYRLKQVDFNGEENYSDLREVIISGSLPDKVSIYPNPAGSFVNVDIPADIDNVKTEIRTVDGRVLMNNTFSNTTQAAVSIEHLTPGMYYIHIQMGDQNIVRPFVKQ